MRAVVLQSRARSPTVGVVGPARAARLGHNQSVVRSLNARLEHGLVTPKSPFGADGPGFLCECSNLDCTEIVYVDLGTYAEVRRHERRFFVRTGHDIPEIERIVGEGRGYVVVEKVGTAAAAVAGDG
jgi:hypothetical protein